MPALRIPLEEYEVRGTTGTADGIFLRHQVHLRLTNATPEDIYALEDFLKNKGWIR